MAVARLSRGSVRADHSFMFFVPSIGVSWHMSLPRSGSCPRLVRLACTGFPVPGYGTGVEGSAADTAVAGVRGFPVVLTSFVGREQAVREVAGLLEEYRLVMVTGPGGVGKTRLAGEIASQVAGRFADGAWLIELAPVRDPVQVARVAAVALGVREQPGVPAAEGL